MKRFFSRIHEKACDVTARPVITVAFGDSVTQGLFSHLELNGAATYHAILQRFLETFYPLTTFSTLNAGVSGDSVPNALKRIDRDVISHQPDLVIVAFGLNDSTRGLDEMGTFKTALREIVQRLRKDTSADILIFTPGFMAQKTNAAIHPAHAEAADIIIQAQTSGTLAQYAETIREVAQEHNLPLVDVHKEWTRITHEGMDTDRWLSNGLNHPNQTGHEIAAMLALQVLFNTRA